MQRQYLLAWLVTGTLLEFFVRAIRCALSRCEDGDKQGTRLYETQLHPALGYDSGFGSTCPVLESGEMLAAIEDRLGVLWNAWRLN
ncbi:hypothetical protein Micbo1qcDRAFT_162796 [Microdochium bolleyi]|uniref:Secreted protein n=1 Tax=Microdochium bolleyi TaxID=196109 RepID=A0A136J5W0_9PEZI|nr:hypothetical protein Micbo1qcDRAFT_162796 [Microdochium bolleyi]